VTIFGILTRGLVASLVFGIVIGTLYSHEVLFIDAYVTDLNQSQLDHICGQTKYQLLSHWANESNCTLKCNLECPEGTLVKLRFEIADEFPWSPTQEKFKSFLESLGFTVVEIPN